MTNEQKEAITRLRLDGWGYDRISKHLEIKENTVKSFCRRHGLKKEDLDALSALEEARKRLTKHYCKNCGVEVVQYPGRREKKFCCDHCRNVWWNAHIGDVKRKAMYDFICPTCGKEFHAYGNRNRKYCGHACYIKARFGSPEDIAHMAASPEL